MGEFEDSESSAPPLAPVPNGALRLVALALVAVIVVVALYQLVY